MRFRGPKRNDYYRDDTNDFPEDGEEQNEEFDEIYDDNICEEDEDEN